MKKALFSFAILAVAAVMVSCGNKTAQNAEGQDSAVAEEQTEAAAEEVSNDYDCDYFSVTGLEGWNLKPGSGSLRMEKDGASITVSNSTISFDKLQENYTKSHEKQADMTVGDITWLVYANESSKLYCLMTDLASEPEKAMMVKTFKVKPDDPDLKKVLESIKLKK